jgi:ribose-phosphate pyrophosphokinase
MFNRFSRSFIQARRAIHTTQSINQSSNPQSINQSSNQSMKYWSTVTAVTALGLTGYYLSNSQTVDCSQGVTTRRWHYYRGTPRGDELKDLRLISGSIHPNLAAEIATYLGIPLTSTKTGQFSDGECEIAINENVRESHTFVIAPISAPVNDSLMELLLLISTLRRSSVAEITAVIPYMGYCRQDKKMTSRVPISAADVATMLEECGVDRVISVDLHTGQIQGFFSPKIAVENLEAVNIGALYFAEKDLDRPVVVAPSSGSVIRAKKFREILSDKTGEVDLAMLIENAYHELDEGGRLIGVAKQLDLVGEVKGHDCIIVEDIVDTACTLDRAAEELIKQGAKRVFAFASHGLLTGGAVKLIRSSPITELVITNTVPFPANGDEDSGNKITQLTLAPLLAETIKRVYTQQSILSLFDVDGAQEGAEQLHSNVHTPVPVVPAADNKTSTTSS